MPEQLRKLSPDRDLQCFFLTPSAIASISEATENSFNVSGSWRQQFDWAVIEWNRDNVYEHPALRYLPDGDLSGIQLAYHEQRTNCVPFESNLFATVDWPYLRIWATGPDGIEHVYFAPLLMHAAPLVDERYRSASGVLSLAGTPQAGDRVGIAMPVAPASTGYPEQHYYYDVQTGDNLATIAAGVANAINDVNAGSKDFSASAQGTSVQVVWNGSSSSAGLTGANGNRITVYGFTKAGSTETWTVPTVTLSGGSFPSTYAISLNFSNILGYQDQAGTDPLKMVRIPTENVRKMRWTWAADLQPASFTRTEFQVRVSNWQVSGQGTQWSVAGPGSRRIEDSDASVTYAGGGWSLQGPGNYSGNTIHFTQGDGDTVTFTYEESTEHQLLLGTRLVPDGADVLVSIDGQPAQQFSLAMPGDDVLVRLPLGTVPGGSHTVVVTHHGPVTGGPFSLFVDFLEICHPSCDLPEFSQQPVLSLATDYDTYHAQALPAERTAWIIQKLGFRGRVNHYAGALWFYELTLPGHIYNSASITFTLPAPGVYGYTELTIGPASLKPEERTVIRHYNLLDDTVDTVCFGLANVINQGYTAIWASVQSNVLTITNRQLTPRDPDPSTTIAISVTPNTGPFAAALSSGSLAGGSAGTPYDDPATDASLYPITQYWRTDTTCGINRAARDWSQAFFTSLKGYGLDAVAAFSTESKNADPGMAAGLAQRRYDGSPVIVNTPAVQTNFSPESVAFWKQIYLDMATLQTNAGMTPYLQFGEVQWWYYPWNEQGDPSISMPFYDTYTQQQFSAAYGRPIGQILTNDVDPTCYPDEVAFLPTLIGNYTSAIRSAVEGVYPGARFEVLYPTDTNATAFNQLINYASDWTSANFTCLKTESFTYTYTRNLDASLASMRTSAVKGFANGARSHLVGIGDATSPWSKEVDLAQSQGMESVVLFALDQYCLIGYPLPPFSQQARSRRLA
jgi:hypothetical protein